MEIPGRYSPAAGGDPDTELWPSGSFVRGSWGPFVPPMLCRPWGRHCTPGWQCHWRLFWWEAVCMSKVGGGWWGWDKCVHLRWYPHNGTAAACLANAMGELSFLANWSQAWCLCWPARGGSRWHDSMARGWLLCLKKRGRWKNVNRINQVGEKGLFISLLESIFTKTGCVCQNSFVAFGSRNVETHRLDQTYCCCSKTDIGYYEKLQRKEHGSQQWADRRRKLISDLLMEDMHIQ